MKLVFLLLFGYVWCGAATLAITAHELPRELWRTQFLAWPLYVGARVYQYWWEYRRIHRMMRRETQGMTTRELFRWTREHAGAAAEEERKEREALKAQGKGSWLW